MDNVIQLSEETSMDLPVDRVLQEAGDMSSVVVIGVKDGKFQLRSSEAYMGDVALHLMAGQKLLMEHLGG